MVPGPNAPAEEVARLVGWRSGVGRASGFPLRQAQGESVRQPNGFTLLELMVVVAIVGIALLLVPAAFGSFGARSRLSSAANTVLASLSFCREQATLDAYETRLEFGWFPGPKGKRMVGTRMWYTNVPAKGTGKLTDDREKQKERTTSRAQERQWMLSEWSELGEGVQVAGVSLEAGQWEKLSEGDSTFQVRFAPDGSVDRGFAIRLECMDLDTKTEFRTVTVLVNPLTAEATSHEGLIELPRQRDAHEFR